MSPVCKMADNGRLTIDQKVIVVLFYAETKSVVATQGRFREHFGSRWAPCKQTIYRLSLGTILQHMRINYIPDFKCFYNNKKVLCVQSMVWHFLRHSVHLRQGTVQQVRYCYMSQLIKLPKRSSKTCFGIYQQFIHICEYCIVLW